MEDQTDTLMRMRENINQMISMHSKKRDELRRYDWVFTAICIAASIIVCGFTFYEYGGDEVGKMVHTGISIISILLLAATLLNSFSNLRVKADDHSRAANEFAILKKEIDSRLAINDMDSRQLDDFIITINEEIADIANIAVISEKDFPRLKHYHLRKEQYRKMVDEHVSDSYPVARFKMWRRIKNNK